MPGCRAVQASLIHTPPLSQSHNANRTQRQPPDTSQTTAHVLLEWSNHFHKNGMSHNTVEPITLTMCFIEKQFSHKDNKNAA